MKSLPSDLRALVLCPFYEQVTPGISCRRTIHHISKIKQHLIMNPLPKEEQSLYAELGSRIANRRKELGISQKELAERINVTPPSLSYVEAGRQRLMVGTLVEIANILGLPPGALIPGSETQEPEGLTKHDAALIGRIFRMIRSEPGLIPGEASEP